MLLINITGLFKEFQSSKENKDIINYFSRTLTIVPVGTGYCILNEQLYISEASNAQKRDFMTDTIQPVENFVPQTPTILSDDLKQQMIIALSQQTNMNIQWSLKCLEEVQWNYENARIAFQNALGLGQIPLEAFQN